MVERKEGREREREKRVVSSIHKRIVPTFSRRRLPAVRGYGTEEWRAARWGKKKKGGAWQEAFEKLFSASTVSRGFPTPIPRHNWMG